MNEDYKTMIKEVSKKLLDGEDLIKNDVTNLLNVIGTLEEQIKLYQTIIREGRHVTVE